MFKDAREAAGMSQEQASMMLHIGRRSLSDYENEKTLVPPDVALRMSEVYVQPDLYARYCAGHCPIGRQHAHPVEDRCFEGIVLGLVSELGSIKSSGIRLAEIAEDGVIDSTEVQDFDAIVQKLDRISRKAMNLKLQYQKMARKREKPAVCMAAEKRASYNF